MKTSKKVFWKICEKHFLKKFRKNIDEFSENFRQLVSAYDKLFTNWFNS